MPASQPEAAGKEKGGKQKKEKRDSTSSKKKKERRESKKTKERKKTKHNGEEDEGHDQHEEDDKAKREHAAQHEEKNRKKRARVTRVNMDGSISLVDVFDNDHEGDNYKKKKSTSTKKRSSSSSSPPKKSNPRETVIENPEVAEALRKYLAKKERKFKRREKYRRGPDADQEPKPDSLSTFKKKNIEHLYGALNRKSSYDSHDQELQKERHAAFAAANGKNALPDFDISNHELTGLPQRSPGGGQSHFDSMLQVEDEVVVEEKQQIIEQNAFDTPDDEEVLEDTMTGEDIAEGGDEGEIMEDYEEEEEEEEDDVYEIEEDEDEGMMVEYQLNDEEEEVSLDDITDGEDDGEFDEEAPWNNSDDGLEEAEKEEQNLANSFEIEPNAVQVYEDISCMDFAYDASTDPITEDPPDGTEDNNNGRAPQSPRRKLNRRPLTSMLRNKEALKNQARLSFSNRSATSGFSAISAITEGSNEDTHKHSPDNDIENQAHAANINNHNDDGPKQFDWTAVAESAPVKVKVTRRSTVTFRDTDSVVVYPTWSDKGSVKSQKITPRPKRNPYKVCFCFFMALLSIAAVVLLALNRLGIFVPLQDSENEPADKSTSLQPTPAPRPATTSPAPTSISFSFVADAILDTFGKETYNAVVFNNSSPQAEAAMWIGEEDTVFSFPLNPQDSMAFRQRYATVVFYYATNGPLWVDQLGFLARGVNECNWNGRSSVLKGIFCVDDTTTRLEIVSNGLSGSLPQEIGALIDLQIVTLNDNNIGGTIPDGLYDLTNLRALEMPNNPQLTGTFNAAMIGKLTSLESLWIENSKMLGSVPSQLFGELMSLESIILASNSFIGSIPNNLRSLARLEVVNLRDNFFSGTVPSSLTDLPSLTTLDISLNKLTGRVPAGSYPSLKEFIAYSNRLTGSVPPFLLVNSLETLSLAKNRFSGNLPLNWFVAPSLSLVDVSENDLQGSMPTELGWLSKLKSFSVRSCGLSGSLPAELDRTPVAVLDVADNFLKGTVPESYARLPLTQFSFGYNSIEGDVSFLCDRSYIILSADCPNKVVCPCCTECTG